jgi:hypothetical protein
VTVTVTTASFLHYVQSRFRLSEPYTDRVQKPGTTAATPPAANSIGSKVVESHGKPRIVKKSVSGFSKVLWGMEYVAMVSLVVIGGGHYLGKINLMRGEERKHFNSITC